MTDSVLLSLLDASLRAAGLLGLAGAIVLVLRRGPASARYGVWKVALLGVLVLPGATLVLPNWSAPLPEGVRAWVTSDPVDAGVGVGAVGEGLAGVVGGSPAAARPRGWAWAELLLLAWLGGASALLLRLGAGLAALRRLAREAETVTDRSWQELASALSREIGLARRVRLLRASRPVAPMTWGWFRPAVLLPDCCDAWDPERRRVVLAHELVHVRRRDWVIQVVSQVVVAVQWFNPLAWWGARRLSIERERACDEAVVAVGTPATEYARHLVEMARTIPGRGARPGVALAMARQSQLEGRLMSILDPKRTRRRGLAVPAALLMICGTLAISTAALPAAHPHPEAEARSDRGGYEERVAKLRRMERLVGELADLERRLARGDLDRAALNAMYREVIAVRERLADERDRGRRGTLRAVPTPPVAPAAPAASVEFPAVVAPAVVAPAVAVPAVTSPAAAVAPTPPEVSGTLTAPTSVVLGRARPGPAAPAAEHIGGLARVQVDRAPAAGRRGGVGVVRSNTARAGLVERQVKLRRGLEALEARAASPARQITEHKVIVEDQVGQILRLQLELVPLAQELNLAAVDRVESERRAGQAARRSRAIGERLRRLGQHQTDLSDPRRELAAQLGRAQAEVKEALAGRAGALRRADEARRAVERSGRETTRWHAELARRQAELKREVQREVERRTGRARGGAGASSTCCDGASDKERERR